MEFLIMNKIDCFDGEYAFLSNFYDSPIEKDGIVYPTNEHFFQAMKTLDNEERKKIAAAETPGKAKRMGRNVKLRPGFLTMDFGAKFDGYCSDMTRTIVLGKADSEMKRIYETVLTAQKEAMKFIRAGVSCKDADKVARDIISDAGYGEYFSHSLGHSLGLEIHELPSLSPRSVDTLVAGNIVTVEPGIYIPGKYGVRIENMVLVTQNGCESLTNSDNSLIEI
jgi:Xaa-Pro aminopeptidase